MYYLINVYGEHCAVDYSKEEAEKIVCNSDFYESYVYSNYNFMC